VAPAYTLSFLYIAWPSFVFGSMPCTASSTGFTGFFGYVFGSALSGTGVGWIADHWGWSGVFSTMVACCLLTIVFSAFTLGHQATSAERAT